MTGELMRKTTAIVLMAYCLTACVSTKNVPLDVAKLESSKPQSLVVTARGKPDFSAMTPGKAAFAMLGAAGAISEGNKIVKENNVEDPANYISTEVTKVLSKRFKISSVKRAKKPTQATDATKLANDYPTGGLIVDVQTINWSFIYFPTDWSHFRVIYSAKMRLVDGKSKKMLAEGFCSRVPEKDESSPTKDQLLANSAARLKKELQISAGDCVKQLVDNVINVKG